MPENPSPNSPAPQSNGGSSRSESGGDVRKFFVGPEAVGKAPPARRSRREEVVPEPVEPGPVATAVAVVAPPAIDPEPPAEGPEPAEPPAPAPAEKTGLPPKVFVPGPGAPPPRRSMLAPDRKAGGTGAPPATKAKSKVGGPPKRRKVRRRILQIAAVIVLIPVVVGVAGLVWAQSKFSEIERVDVAGVLDGGGGDGQNILMVGSDEGADRLGQRSDTIMLLRIEPDRSLVMSIPRDLFVTLVPGGNEQRINAAYNEGPASLIQTIQSNLDIPIHRYMEVDFVTFAALVDAVGGVTIEFPHPAFDPKSGLNIQETGPVQLDGAQSLAYVRSRQYTEIIDGRPVTDPSSDIGRVMRQQQFMRVLFSKIGDSRNPIELVRIGEDVGEGLRIDNDMSLLDALRLGLRMRDLNPESVPLPTEPFTLDSGAQVLGLDEDGAEPALEQFR